MSGEGITKIKINKIITKNFSSCGSLQNMGFCRDELFSRSRQRWYDVVDVFLHPYSVGTFLCVVQLLPHGTESNSQSHPSLGFEGPQFNTYAYQDVSKASSDECEYLAILLGSYHATYTCAYKVSRHYLWHNEKTERMPLPSNT